MHIEPGLVDGTKIILSYATAMAAIGYSAKLAVDAVKKDGMLALLMPLKFLHDHLVGIDIILRYLHRSLFH